MLRRAFLELGAATAVIALTRPSQCLAAAPLWRTFELVTHIEVVAPSGAAQAWIPLPMPIDTDWQKHADIVSVTSNGQCTKVTDGSGPSLLHARWPAGEGAPLVEVTVRVSTRDRVADLTNPGSARESKANLEKYLLPSRLITTGGLVKEKALVIAADAPTDVEKARRIYQWIVDNTFRDPAVRGCGNGDIESMLQTGNLSGKCADLNSLFVGMARSVGVPARDLYGVRVAPSAVYSSLGKSGDITKSQHCRAEFYAEGHGWVPVDPADVRKLVLEEGGGLPLMDPKIVQARANLFGSVEMNWIAYNDLHDVALPGAAGDPLPFFMYPQVQTDGRWKDCLDPASVKYTLTSREIV